MSGIGVREVVGRSFIPTTATVILILFCLRGSEVAAFNGYPNGVVRHCFGAGEIFVHMYFPVKGEDILVLGVVARLR